MKLHEDAISSYLRAKEFSGNYLGADDGITINLTNIYEKAKNEVSLKGVIGGDCYVVEEVVVEVC